MQTVALSANAVALLRSRVKGRRFPIRAPDASGLSGAAREVLRRHLAGEDEVTESNRAPYRELAAARVMIPLSGFASGLESRYIFTYSGWRMRFEFAGMACAGGDA